MERLRSVLVVLLALGCSPQGRAQAPDQQGPPTALARAYQATRGPVEAEMRHVLYHVDDRVILQIQYLRGALLPMGDEPPWFDDPRSFALAIDTGAVTISTASLSALLNEYTFNYDGSPLGNLTVTVEKGELKQTGTLHKGVPLPFTIRAELSTTPDGRLRLHPTAVKVAGIGVKGLMKTFGIELENLVKVRPGRGVEIADNDFLLAPAGLLPPPRIEGRVTAVRIDGQSIEQTFGGSKRPGRGRTLHPADRSAPNYMYYRGKVLRFGKLTMMDADLQIVDADPDDPFDFDLAHLNEQLVAGESHNQPDFGLVTVLPDYGDMRRVASAPASAKKGRASQ